MIGRHSARNEGGSFINATEDMTGIVMGVEGNFKLEADDIVLKLNDS